LKTNETDKFWDRNALYEEVWTTPMQRLAEKYGISDVGLAKVCRKLSIPRPGRGDWARIAAGQIVARTPLPKLSQEIRVWKPMPRKKLPQIEQIANEQERLQLERLEQLPGEYVLKHGSLSHPLVAQARIVLARSTEDDRHILQVREQCLDIRVSKNSLDRALRIMAGLISLIENEGFVVKVGKNSREQTTAVIHEQEIAFGIVEKAERVDAISLPSENILKKVSFTPANDIDALFLLAYRQLTADRLTSKERQRMIAIASKKIDGREGETVIRDDFLTIDFALFSSGVDERLHRLYAAREIVVSDPEILSGTPVIKGTRVPVYDIAASVAAGIPMGRILSSYPSLKCEQVELAALFAGANPSRGRPRQQTTVPSWTTVVTKRRKLSTKPV
jgi:uncharacterized protein (DUF433 family)